MTRLSRWQALLGGLRLAAAAACASKPVLNDVGVAYGPAGRRVLLAQVNDPKGQNLRPLIGELTTLLLPELLA